MDIQGLSKIERLKYLKENGLLNNRHTRKLEKFSNNFNLIVTFFLQSYRKGLLNFGGIGVDTFFKSEGYSAKEAFRRFEDGQYNNLQPMESRHNNVMKALIIAKKSWGLHVKMWTEGIVDCDFTIDEIVDAFTKHNITIPDGFLKGLKNEVLKQKINKYEQYLKNC